ncbi:Phospholipase/carboxylesterase/thioesterase [Mycena floridula]|nr:Phospholipase/carboxylesterase/thioesterase [Mycena floridula]
MADAVVAPKAIILPSLTAHTATVIFVHGLGDTGKGWEPVATMFQRDPALSHVKWILPHSPIRPVTANMGMEMPSWFNILAFGFNNPEDEAGMIESASSIGQLITDEIQAGLPENRIVLAGFSQGGTMSILTGLRCGRKLAGIASLSGWVALRHRIASLAVLQKSSIPIFWGHGSADPLIKIQLVQDSINVLKHELGYTVTNDSTECKGICYNVYHGIGHTTNQKELDDLRTWIDNAIPKDDL